MTILGSEQELGATYQAERIESNEEVFGIGVIKIDDDKSYLIQMFETNDFTDDAPALAYYVPVKTASIISFNDFYVEQPKVLSFGKK